MGCKSGAVCLIPHRTSGIRFLHLVWYLDSGPGGGEAVLESLGEAGSRTDYVHTVRISIGSNRKRLSSTVF